MAIVYEYAPWFAVQIGFAIISVIAAHYIRSANSYTIALLSLFLLYLYGFAVTAPNDASASQMGVLVLLPMLLGIAIILVIYALGHTLRSLVMWAILVMFFSWFVLDLYSMLYASMQHGFHVALGAWSSMYYSEEIFFGYSFGDIVPVSTVARLATMWESLLSHIVWGLYAGVVLALVVNRNWQRMIAGLFKKVGTQIRRIFEPWTSAIAGRFRSAR